MLRKILFNRLKSNNYNFLANLLLFIKVEKVDKDCVAYVKHGGSLTIYTGIQFEEFSQEERIAVILHELLHMPQIQIIKELRLKYKNHEKFNKRQMATIENYGLDASVNRDINNMQVFKLPDSAILPSNLNIASGTDKPPPNDNLEELQYIQYVIDNLPEDDGEGNVGEGEGEDCEGEELKEALKGALDKLEQEIKEGKVAPSESDKKFGIGLGSDLLKVFKKKGKLPNDIVKQLESVKKKLKPIRGTKTVYAYTWGRRHKAFPSKTLPATLKQEFIKRTEKVVIVMDSSGSCWNETNFEVGLRIVDWFKERGLLAGFWACDTELSKVIEGQLFCEIKGGGGTEFGKRHVNQIVDDVGEDVSILYITDGELDLSDANKRIDTHVLVCF